jgi:Pyruvate/2-oxoacid:ferredoxin oxidoreductase delta subunit
MTNAERRAVLLARFEERLRELWPDEAAGRRVPFADFNDLEAKATILGDETTRRIMESALATAMDLPASELPERCTECGRKLQYSRKPKITETIRGPVRAERDYAYCRGCRRGFSPR